MISRYCSSLRYLLEKTLINKRGYREYDYKTKFEKNDGKQVVKIFHHNLKIFEYNLTEKKIISFDIFSKFDISNLNKVIKEIFKLEGTFTTRYAILRKDDLYRIIYVEKDSFYDINNKKIDVDLEEEKKIRKRNLSKQRYNKIKDFMKNTPIELNAILNCKIWLERIDNKWYIYSDLEKDVYFPITAREAFSVVSSNREWIENSQFLYKKCYVEYLFKKINDGTFDKWSIKISNNNLNSIYKIIKNEEDKGNTYYLDSEGDIYFDQRILTKDQVFVFIKYLLDIKPNKYLNKNEDLISLLRFNESPDVIYNTPLNLTLSDNYLRIQLLSSRIRINYNIDEVGKEFRIVRSEGSKFTAISIYGKQCSIYEHDVDSLILHSQASPLLNQFNMAMMLEKIPERIEIIKKILPDIINIYIKGKGSNPKLKSVKIEDKKLVITNRNGKFHLSLVDGVLHKVSNTLGHINKRYICVGIDYDKKDKELFYIYRGVKYYIDDLMSEILSKLIMLLEERYPDELTRIQIVSKF